MIRPAEKNDPPPAPPGQHMLSFDVEEYFQVEAAAGCVDRDQWLELPRRLDGCIERLLALLADHGASATFFILGWVARHESQIVRNIAAAGHEIASHGMDHRMIHTLAASEFSQDLRSSRAILEDISGRKVIGYRAPTFSITHETAWAIDALCEAGYEYDSSVFPIHHDRYGVPSATPAPHIAIGPGGGRLLEIPPLTVRAMGTNWPVGGGGYLRLLPGWVTRWAVSAAQRRKQPAMIYLHPWELDPHQPRLGMKRLDRWRHRLRLGSTEAKLNKMLGKFCFGGAAQYLRSDQALGLPSYRYGLDVEAPAEVSAGREKSKRPGAL